MSELWSTARPAWPWLAGLVLVVAACVGIGIWLLWWASELQLQVNHFYSSSGNRQVEESVYAFYDRIGRNAYVMQQLSGPVLSGGPLALIGLIAVLARRWDRRSS